MSLSAAWYLLALEDDDSAPGRSLLLSNALLHRVIHGGRLPHLAGLGDQEWLPRHHVNVLRTPSSTLAV